MTPQDSDEDIFKRLTPEQLDQGMYCLNDIWNNTPARSNLEREYHNPELLQLMESFVNEFLNRQVPKEKINQNFLNYVTYGTN